MIASTASEKASRALQSKTRQAVQVIDYQIGNQIEVWKQPSNKDLSKPDGDIHLEWQGNTLIRH
eukprot:7762962-Prorocentrum_lima.AAC.1